MGMPERPVSLRTPVAQPPPGWSGGAGRWQLAKRQGPEDDQRSAARLSRTVWPRNGQWALGEPVPTQCRGTGWKPPLPGSCLDGEGGSQQQSQYESPPVTRRSKITRNSYAQSAELQAKYHAVSSLLPASYRHELIWFYLFQKKAL